MAWGCHLGPPHALGAEDPAPAFCSGGTALGIPGSLAVQRAAPVGAGTGALAPGGGGSPGGEAAQATQLRTKPAAASFFFRGQSGTHARLAPRDFSRGLEIDQSERLVLFIPSELLDNTCLQPA
jgi:hypothetical protein